MTLGFFTMPIDPLGKIGASHSARIARWRVAKSIFVADGDRTVRDHVTAPNSPYRRYYHSLAIGCRSMTLPAEKMMPLVNATLVDHGRAAAG
jgi:hypothetical protein